MPTLSHITPNRKVWDACYHIKNLIVYKVLGSLFSQEYNRLMYRKNLQVRSKTVSVFHAYRFRNCCTLFGLCPKLRQPLFELNLCPLVNLLISDNNNSNYHSFLNSVSVVTFNIFAITYISLSVAIRI